MTQAAAHPLRAAGGRDAPQPAGSGVYEFEPEEEDILKELLPRNLAVQLYTALLENAAPASRARA